MQNNEGSKFRNRDQRQDDQVEPSFNLRLIEAVRHSRCLYDTTDRLYRNADHKMKIWDRLVHALNFDGDARTLYSRWKQLRDKYGKEKRKARYSGATTWQYFKILQFLDPHMIDRANQPSPVRKEPDEIQMLCGDPNWGLTVIEEVQKRPCLFDIRDPKYRSTEHRTIAWTEMVKTLCFPGDANSMYKQWKKLRDRYVREKRRIREQRDRGVHEDSTWELYDHMMWMDPYLDDRLQTVKRKQDDELSDYEMDDMGHSFHSDRRPNGGADVLLDGDSAFAASAVSDLRSLPEPQRSQAKEMILQLLETGIVPPMTF